MPVLDLRQVGLLAGSKPVILFIPGRDNARYRQQKTTVGPSLPQCLRSRPLAAPLRALDDSFDFTSGSSEDEYGQRSRNPGRRRSSFPTYPKDSSSDDSFRNLGDAELEILWRRLIEDDVDYNDMKKLCKSHELGGKDMKYRLRAKLIVGIGKALGKPTWNKEKYRKMKSPEEMSDDELEDYFQERGNIQKPDGRDESVGFARALILQDLLADKTSREDINALFMPPAASSEYESINSKELAMMLQKRGLSSNGSKQELINRLVELDNKERAKTRMLTAQAAAQLEQERASIDLPPRPPNKMLAMKLKDAVHTASMIGTMTLPELRTTAFARNLPVYGTVEALRERIMDVLRKEAVEAYAGKDRLLSYATAAVEKLSEAEVIDALNMYGIVTTSVKGGAEEEKSRLVNALVQAWIESALNSTNAQTDDDDQDEFSQEIIQDEEGDASMMLPEESTSTRTGGSLEENRTVDPTIDVYLLCSGQTQSQREAALASARVFIPHLQTDELWGVVNPEQEIFPRDISGSIGDVPGMYSPSEPPSEHVSIQYLIPMALGYAVSLWCPSVSPGTNLVVTATPYTPEGEPDESNAIERVFPVNDLVILQGLSPNTTYNISARLRNAAGDGPEETEIEPLFGTTLPRSGIAAYVLYEVPDSNSELFIKLDWEHVFGWNSKEIDVFAKAVAARGHAKTLEAQLATIKNTGIDSMMLPLGPISSSCLDSVSKNGTACMIGSWAEPEIRELALSRPAFAAAAKERGFGAVELLELSASDVADESKIVDWLKSQGEDPDFTRVAVRIELAGCVISAGIGRGANQVTQGAQQLIEKYNCSSVVLEVVAPAAVYFTCCVLSGPEGIVALPPTEITYEDLEEDFFEFDLELDKFYALTGGQDQDTVDAFVKMQRESRRLPPGALGGMPLASQRYVHYTPPSSLPADATENIRLAAAKLFKELKLTDFAQFSGCVVPNDPLEVSDLKSAVEILKKAKSVEESATNGENEAGSGNDVGSPPPKTFAELKALYDEEQARLASTHTTSEIISQADRSQAVDIQNYAQAGADDGKKEESALQEGRGPRTDYGMFNGILLDDRTREDLLKENPPPPAEPIPASIPTVQPPSALPAIETLSASDLCLNSIPGYRIAFSQIDLSLSQFGDRLGVLAQQSAAVGLSLSTLPRQLVSNAAVRASLPALAPPIGLPEDFFTDEEEDNVANAAANGYDSAPSSSNYLATNNNNTSVSAFGLSLSGMEGPLVDESNNQEIYSASKNRNQIIEDAPRTQEDIFTEMRLQLEQLEAERRNLPPYPNPFSSSDEELRQWEEVRSQMSSSPATQPAPDNEGDDFDFSYDAIRAEQPMDSEGMGLSSGFDSFGFDDSGIDLFDAPPPSTATITGSAELGTQQDPALDVRLNFPGLHPTRQRVWILCGGEGPQRDESLKAAIHAAATLQNEQDLLIETFFLDPYDAGVSENDRRRTLLQRRLDLLKMGATDDNLLEDCPEYHPTRIRHPIPPSPEELSWRGVWKLGSTSVVRTNVPDLKRGCEETLRKGTTAWLNRRPGDVLHQEEKMLVAVKKELEYAGLATDGPALWGGYYYVPDDNDANEKGAQEQKGYDDGDERSLEEPSQNIFLHMEQKAPKQDYSGVKLPEFQFLKDWVDAAQQKCVVVLLALPGHPIAHGPLQRLFESKQVPFTGPSSVSAELCADRPELLRKLGNEPPFFTCSLLELAAMCETESTADEWHAKLFGGWEGKILSIRPVQSYGGGLGIMKAACGRDLQIYYSAIQESADTIPAELLVGEEEDVRMPVPPPVQFIIEPASTNVWLTLHEDSLQQNTATQTPPPTTTTQTPTASNVKNQNVNTMGNIAHALASHLTWPSAKDPSDGWLEVKACLVGGAGKMMVLSLTATVVQLTTNPVTGEEESTGSFELTPIPPNILSSDKAFEVQLRLVGIADTAALSGAAQITALVNTKGIEACEVIVREIDPHPDLSPQGLLMRQAAVSMNANPQSHKTVLREMLKVGMSREGEESFDDTEISWLREDPSPYQSSFAALSTQSSFLSSDSPYYMYWGEPDLEIDPDKLYMTAEELEDMVREAKKKQKNVLDRERARRSRSSSTATSSSSMTYNDDDEDEE